MIKLKLNRIKKNASWDVLQMGNNYNLSDSFSLSKNTNKEEANKHMNENIIKVGEQFNHYHIQNTIGEGGMGVVYKAMDIQLHRQVALKIMKNQEDEINSKRFLLEAKAMAQFEHPNIVKIYEVGNTPQKYIAMEYVEGQSFTQLIHNKIDIIQIVKILRQISNALHIAHKNNIIHRDIKPSNILVSNSGKAKLMDFGLIKFYDSSNMEKALSCPDDIIGTLSYMAPEQLQGKPDKRSDIYSLGATMYQALTGVPPFQGQTWNIMHQIMTSVPLPIRQVNKAIPIRLAKICNKCMEQKIEKRYQSAKLLEQDFINFLHNKKNFSRTQIGFSCKIKYVMSFLVLLCFLFPILYSFRSHISRKELSSKEKAKQFLKIGEEFSRKNDHEKAFVYFYKAYQKGSSRACVYIGASYYEGKGVNQSYKKAYKYYLHAAENNESDAMYVLGIMYRKGQYVERDFKKSLYWMEKSASLKNPAGIYELARIYSYGSGVAHDELKAAKLYLEAGKTGYGPAQIALALLHYYGVGIKPNKAEGLRILKKLASEKKMRAIYVLQNIENIPFLNSLYYLRIKKKP